MTIDAIMDRFNKRLDEKMEANGMARMTIDSTEGIEPDDEITVGDSPTLIVCGIINDTDLSVRLKDGSN